MISRLIRFLAIVVACVSPVLGKEKEFSCDYSHVDGRITLTIRNNSQSPIVICNVMESFHEIKIKRGERIISPVAKTQPTIESEMDWVFLRALSKDSGKSPLARVRRSFKLEEVLRDPPNLLEGDILKLVLRVRSVEPSGDKIILGPVREVEVECGQANKPVQSTHDAPLNSK